MLGALILGGLIGAAWMSSQTSEKVVYVDRNKKKIAFYDAYRRADKAAARLCGVKSYGITAMIDAIQKDLDGGGYYGRERRETIQGLRLLRDLRRYRNNLAHDRRRWNQIPDPTDDAIFKVSRLADNLEAKSGLAYNGYNRLY